MKRYIAVLEIDDNKEIVGSIDTTVSYTYRRNGTNYARFERVEFKEESEEEQKKAAEIKIGDEVTDDKEWEGVVTWISPLGEYLVIILKDGTALHWNKKDFKKTGRHFPQLEEVLKQMRE